VDLFGWFPGYSHYIYQNGKEPMFLLFLAFLIAFTLTRGYTRLARTRGWGSGNVGGVHLHHVVPGIILALLAGVLSFSSYADNDIVEGILAIVFGVGAALVLDEFALIFHLKDVYWSDEGRSSIDATIIGVLVSGLLLVTSSPFELSDDADAGDPKGIVFSILAFNLIFAVITFLKGKYFMGVIAIFVPIFGWIGSCRLAKPYSPWAHWFYDPERVKRDGLRRRRRERKLDRAWNRYETGRMGRFENWFIDFIGGKPHLRPTAESAAAPGQEAVPEPAESESVRAAP
jgi:hypothetical protein